MSPYVKESTPVAVKAANTLPEPKPGSDGSVTLPNFTGFTYGEVRDWLHRRDLPLNRMELVRLHLKMKVAVQLFRLVQQLLFISVDKTNSVIIRNYRQFVI